MICPAVFGYSWLLNGFSRLVTLEFDEVHHGSSVYPPSDHVTVGDMPPHIQTYRNINKHHITGSYISYILIIVHNIYIYIYKSLHKNTQNIPTYHWTVAFIEGYPLNIPQNHHHLFPTAGATVQGTACYLAPPPQASMASLQLSGATHS